MIKNIFIFALSTFSFSMLFFYFSLSKKMRAANISLVKLYLTNSFQNQNNNLGIEINDIDIHKENFIKFLSDSRESAYEYIDNAQKQIKEFIDIADQQFAFFDKYGILSEGDLHYETMKVISEEYKKLKFLLPEEADDRR